MKKRIFISIVLFTVFVTFFAHAQKSRYRSLKSQNEEKKEKRSLNDWEIQTGISIPLNTSKFFGVGPNISLGKKLYISKSLYYSFNAGINYFPSKLDWMDGYQMEIPVSVLLSADIARWNDDYGKLFIRFGYTGAYQYSKYGEEPFPNKSYGNSTGLCTVFGSNFKRYGNFNIGAVIGAYMYTAPDDYYDIGGSMLQFNLIVSF